jgi:hypothetical protein
VTHEPDATDLWQDDTTSMYSSISRVVMVAAVSLVACGGDDGGGGADPEDFLGNYQVTSHRENHQQGTPVPCSDPGEEIQPDDPGGAPYFAIAVDEDFDSPDLMVFQVCTGPGTGCSNTMFRLEPGEDGLESTRSNTSTAGSCNLYAGISRFSLDGDVATFEDRQWSSFDVPESDCTLDAADALIGTADCQDVEVWVGTRL